MASTPRRAAPVNRRFGPLTKCHLFPFHRSISGPRRSGPLSKEPTAQTSLIDTAETSNSALLPAPRLGVAWMAQTPGHEGVDESPPSPLETPGIASRTRTGRILNRARIRLRSPSLLRATRHRPNAV